MKYTDLSDDDMDVVQTFAFGGIANPVQSPSLRAADREFLAGRQAELDAFEEQRQAYNTALQDWQTNVYQPYQQQVGAYNTELEKYKAEVYDPYQQQVGAYNTAAEKYNKNVYTPYQTQYSAYETAFNAYNANPTRGYRGVILPYAGPAAPTLSSTFDMAAPVAPTPFGMTAPEAPKEFDLTAPVLPFNEEEVVSRQEQAAKTAEKDAQNRATAINVVSNPDQFNFGSMSIANRFMAEGGPVDKDTGPSARDMLNGMAGFAKGGLAEVNADNLSDEEDTSINTDPLGSAQKYMEQLTEADRPSPTRQSIKRMPKSSGGASAAKEMKLQTEALASAKDLVPELSDKGSSRQQMEELARAYQLKINAARNTARGLASNTFGAPTLEAPSLTKNTLAKQRFAEGGEAKKPKGAKAPSSYSEGLPAPGILNAKMWADTVSRDMYPEESDDVKRDAARHLLASAILADKTGPGIAKFLGGAYEFKEAPVRTAGHFLGLSDPRADYPTDMHNNAIGRGMSSLVRDPRLLEEAVQRAIRTGSTKVEPGRAALVPDNLNNMRYGSAPPKDGAEKPSAKQRFAEGGEAKKFEGAEGSKNPSAARLLRRLALAVARGVPQAVTGLVDLAALPLTATGRMKAEDVVGTTDYLTKRGLLPQAQEGLASESAELLSSMASPGGAAKAAVVGMLGPKGIIEAARRSQLFKGKGLEIPEETFSAQEMLKRLQEQGVDTKRTWLRGKKENSYKGMPNLDYDTLEYLYDYQKRPDAVEAAMRDSRRSQASEGRTLSRQLEDRSDTKFNTKGGVWLTESPSLAQTYTGGGGYTIPVYAPRPDAVIDAKGEQWSDFYKNDKSWKEAFKDPNVRLVEVKNIIDAGPHWTSMISPDASEKELRELLTATNLFAKKPFDNRVVNKITGEPYKYKKGGVVKKRKNKQG